MVIQEDLNGVNWNRMPAGLTLTQCETYLLDMSIPNPSFKDLIRLTASAPGAEITGATPIDSKTMLINSQHPSGNNPPPYNNSLTYAISGFDGTPALGVEQMIEETPFFSIYPNPVSRELHFNEVSDVAIYNAMGQRVKVAREVSYISVNDLTPGHYFIRNTKGETLKFVVE
jgi:hypothetical protein